MNNRIAEAHLSNLLYD